MASTTISQLRALRSDTKYILTLLKFVADAASDGIAKGVLHGYPAGSSLLQQVPASQNCQPNELVRDGVKPIVATGVQEERGEARIREQSQVANTVLQDKPPLQQQLLASPPKQIRKEQPAMDPVAQEEPGHSTYNTITIDMADGDEIELQEELHLLQEVALLQDQELAYLKNAMATSHEEQSHLIQDLTRKDERIAELQRAIACKEEAAEQIAAWLAS